MMIISVENLGKRYTIRHQAGRPSGGYSRLSEDLVRAAKAPFRAITSRFRGGVDGVSQQDMTSTEDFWALRNVSFEVKEGEVLGIIGRNGAGKSTLLKILSRITEPSDGRVRIRGRVASLLEVGTGFHPELTGRENVYLNGAVLGMSRAEVGRKFDEIVAFSEVEKFLDTPIKRYSSGMYVRLAFAVAAHLDPEILIVDEVLAVGDVAFQRKCLGKMRDSAGRGRTVLFVSHQLGAVQGLCNRAIMLESGRVAAEGSTDDVVAAYVASASVPVGDRVWQPDDADGAYELYADVRDIGVICGKSLTFAFEIRSEKPCADPTVGLVLYDLHGAPVLGASSKLQRVQGRGSGVRWHVTCDMGSVPLTDGRFTISVWFGEKDRDLAKFSSAFTLHVEEGDPFDWGNKVPRTWGFFYWTPEWKIQLPD